MFGRPDPCAIGTADAAGGGTLTDTRRFDGFYLVSSDSDFTGLALRIREEGLTVYGFGECKTPEAFRNACQRFVFTEVYKKLSDHVRARTDLFLTEERTAPGPSSKVVYVRAK